MIKFICGLRWGNAFWSNKGSYGNATIPFATLEITNEHCIITRTFFGLKLERAAKNSAKSTHLAKIKCTYPACE